MTQNLLPRFASIVRDTPSFTFSDVTSSHPLLLDSTEIRGKQINMVYAPFDHLNRDARIAIVGMTPGAFQAAQALKAARSALLDGRSPREAARAAKVHASFSGEPMRSNLIRMMDAIGVAGLLGLNSVESLWGMDSNLVHFTSALRYPVFVEGKNWSGSPDMVRTPRLREWLLAYTGEELGMLGDCLIVPLGPKVGAAMQYLAEQGLIDAKRILDGMPHPSGANQERINCFLGDKPGHLCSPKTNVERLTAARKSLSNKVEAVRSD